MHYLKEFLRSKIKNKIKTLEKNIKKRNFIKTLMYKPQNTSLKPKHRWEIK